MPYRNSHHPRGHQCLAAETPHEARPPRLSHPHHSLVLQEDRSGSFFLRWHREGGNLAGHSGKRKMKQSDGDRVSAEGGTGWLRLSLNSSSHPCTPLCATGGMEKTTSTRPLVFYLPAGLRRWGSLVGDWEAGGEMGFSLADGR